MSESKLVYRTHQIWIKPGHRLYPYLERGCQDAKNLYNTTNFYIRQVFTAFGQNQPLQPLQQQVMDTLQTHIDAMNERLSVKNRSRPKTRLQLNIGKLGYTNGKLMQVRVVPSYGQYVVEMVFACRISMIQYKAAEHGIAVILTEAYTSKASFLDHDPLPPYDEEGTWTFSGKRIHRGLYKSAKGLIHADVNGAANIMRKVFPKASAKGANGIEGLDGIEIINVSTPLVLSILK